MYNSNSTGNYYRPQQATNTGSRGAYQSQYGNHLRPQQQHYGGGAAGNRNQQQESISGMLNNFSKALGKSLT